MIAIVRPSDWDLPLFLHVLGAMVLFGGVGAVALISFAGEREALHSAFARRLAFVTTLALVWPSFLVMRIGAQLIYNKENPDPDFPGWIMAGVVVGDGGALVLLALTLLTWLSLRRRPRAARLVGVLSSLYLIALAVAWWAMSAKPGA